MPTRARRQGGQQPVGYHITDSTNIAKVPMKRLLSHVEKTDNENESDGDDDDNNTF